MGIGFNEDNRKGKIYKRLFQVLLHFLCLAAVLFFGSGSFYWTSAWVYLSIGILASLIATPILLVRNPDVVAECADMKEDIKAWDRKFSLIATIFTLAMLVTAGLDQRFGWSQNFPIQISFLGAVLIAIGYALFFWALLSNKFFSRFVRIQIERDHKVASSGPYRFIRHPGYCGMILALLGTPLPLASWWAAIPAFLSIAAFAVRTGLEDCTLKAELEGYRDYTNSVKYRLLPGVW